MSIEELTKKCEDLLKKSKYNEAIKVSKKILKLDKDNEIALKTMGISNYNLNNFEESEKYLKKAYNSNPTDELIEYYGKSLVKTDKLDKALSLYDSYLNSEDNENDFYVEQYFSILSNTCLNKNRKVDALKCLNYYLNHNPESKKVIDQKRMVLIKFNKFDEAYSCCDSLINIEKEERELKILHYEKILFIEFKALNYYIKFIKQTQKNSINSKNLTVLDEAKNLYSKALKEFKENKYINNSSEWYKFLEITLTNNKNPNDFFKELFNLNEDNLTLWSNKLESIYYRYKEFTLKYCDILLDTYPDAVEILNIKADLLTFINRKKSLKNYMKKSLKLYEKVLEIDESNIDAINGKLDRLYYLNQDEKAYKFIKNLPEINENITGKIKFIASMLKRNEKYSEALNCYEKILESKCFDVESITNIKEILNEPGMEKAKNKSKYYMDWIDVILSRNEWYSCSQEGCYERLYHIVPGLKGPRLLEIPRYSKDIFVKDYIDCDEDATHYCPECKTIYKFDVECFNYDKTDPILYEYAKELILTVKHEIYPHPIGGITYNQLKEKLFRNYHFDKKEFEAFIAKLEEMDYIKNIVQLGIF